MSAEATIRRVKITRDNLIITLSDGTTRSVSLEAYPSLKHASWISRKWTRLIGGGTGIHWPRLDYDLSLEGILKGEAEFIPSLQYAKALRGTGSRHHVQTG